MSLSVCYVLAYRAPDYIRTQNLLRALEKNPDVRLTKVSNTNKGIFRYVEVLQRLWQVRRHVDPDVYILGFRGHEIFWPVRLLTRGRPVIFDALMSPYASLSEEGKAGWLGWLLSPLFFYLERSALRRSSLILTDTQQHATLYARIFGIPREKLCTIPVGAIEPATKPHVTTPSSPVFNVLFYGSFLPLHGVEVIIEAASILRDLPIRFDFIGGSLKQIRQLHARFRQQGITAYTHTAWVPLPTLVNDVIPKASVCLGGPFGTTPQATRVITTKTSQSLALGKSTIIGDVEHQVGFRNKVNCLMVKQGDAASLAEAIRWCFDHQDELPRIGSEGLRLYQDNLSMSVIERDLGLALLKLGYPMTQRHEPH